MRGEVEEIEWGEFGMDVCPATTESVNVYEDCEVCPAKDAGQCLLCLW